MPPILRTAIPATAFALCVLAACLPAAAQATREAERPVPQLQFGSTASFSGFQFQQSTFGSPLDSPIAFPGIQFPGFGSRYDASPQPGAIAFGGEPPAIFAVRDVAETFDARFPPSRFPWTPRANPEPRLSWRTSRGDPFGPAARVAASREGLARHRHPFGTLTAERDRDDRRRTTTAARSMPTQRLATEADARGGRRRPFLD